MRNVPFERAQGRCATADGNNTSTVVALYVKGSVDENDCADDQEVFGGPATLHNTHERGCLTLIEELIQNGGPTTPPTVQ